MGGELYERLHENRALYERRVLQRFPRAFGTHDAEDLVSAALDRAMCAPHQPQAGSEDAWFERLLTNVARDELRRRNGRASAAKGGGALRRTVLLSSLLETSWDIVDVDHLDEADATIERLDYETDRAEATGVATDALAQLVPRDVEVLHIRHSKLPGATRAECAREAGMTPDVFKHTYLRAWHRFVEQVAQVEPTPRCRGIRQLIGELECGHDSPAEAAAARGRVDAHVLECSACHAFARESYRVLTPSTAAPLVGPASAGAAAEFGKAGAMAGAGATGAGLLAWLTAGGSLKALTVLCAVSVTAASICGGVAAVLEHRDREGRRPPAKSVAAAPTPSRTAVPTRTPDPIRTATPAPRRTRPAATATASPARATSRHATQAQPAAVSEGATGNEFDPVPATAQPQAAPVSRGVSGEFAP